MNKRRQYKPKKKVVSEELTFFYIAQINDGSRRVIEGTLTIKDFPKVKLHEVSKDLREYIQEGHDCKYEDIQITSLNRL